MKALFLVNRRSGARRRIDVEALIRATAGSDVWQIRTCGAKEELDEVIASAVGAGIDAAIAAGGDGTIHEVAKRLVGTPVALGVIPTGSGNGFARHLGIPMDVRRAIVAAREARIETIDTAVADGIPFVGVMGVGFDACIAERFAAETRRGLWTYVRVGIGGYAAFRPEEYELVVDGQTLRRRATIVAIANTSQYGNEARVAPLASVQDGLLDVVIVEDVPIVRAPMAIARLFRGTFDRTAGVEMLRAREVIVRRAAPGAAHLDGEAVRLGTEIAVRVVPRSLRVLVPPAIHHL